MLVLKKWLMRFLTCLLRLMLTSSNLISRFFMHQAAMAGVLLILMMSGLLYPHSSIQFCVMFLHRMLKWMHLLPCSQHCLILINFWGGALQDGLCKEQPV
jgi:hypothetical protein